jgi:hypothetical protein
MTSAKNILIAAFAILSTVSAFPIADRDYDERSELEFGDKFQGDIVLTPEQEELINGEGNHKGSRTGLSRTQFRWPKNSAGQVIVPYTFQASSGFSKKSFAHEIPLRILAN